MAADRLVDRAAELAGGMDGLVMSVALVTGAGEERSVTFGAPEGERLPSCSSFKPVVAAAVRSAARDRVVALCSSPPAVTTATDRTRPSTCPPSSAARATSRSASTT